MNPLEIRHFGLTYRKQPILRDIDFSLPAKTWLSVIGPNGSGKSTLLKSILRLRHWGQSQGEILLFGKDIRKYRRIDLARQIGYMPQASGMVPPYTCSQFIAFSLYAGMNGQSAAKIRALTDEAMRIAHVAHLASSDMRELSGGQRQLVWLAAAVAQQTPILALDEPASFLDPANSQEMLCILEKLRKSKTIIMVSHDLNQALASGDLCLVLNKGRQDYCGSAEALIQGRGILETAFGCEFSYLQHPRTHKPLVVC